MEIIQRNVGDLIFAEYNPRQLTKDQQKHLKDSITRFGLVDPIVVNNHKDRKNIIVGGHQRVRVATDMGINKVPTVEVKLTYDKERELNVRLNKNTGGWDFDVLANLFEIDELTEWGFNEDELVGFVSDEEVEGLIDDDEIPEVEEAITKTGDLWLLGEHRVLCGDATKKEDVERLMDGNKADMVLTSPPYWNQREYSHWDTFDSYMNDMILVVKSIIINDNSIVFWNIGDDSANNQHISAKHSIMLEQSGLIYIDAIIWKKQGVTGIRLSHQKTKNLYYPGFSFENCLVFQKDNDSFPVFEDKHKNDIPISNVWEISTDSNRGKKHSAPFPVKLPYTAIICYSNNNKNKIYDPFMGSGTTLIACEKTGRKCYGMEIDPHYCDVIVKRYEQFTGKKAERIGKT